MNTIIIILIALRIIFTIVFSVFMVYSFHSNAYLVYKQKLVEFENKKKRIEEDLENDRKRFERNT